jgi:hypothetical protein
MPLRHFAPPKAASDLLPLPRGFEGPYEDRTHSDRGGRTSVAVGHRYKNFRPGGRLDQPGNGRPNAAVMASQITSLSNAGCPPRSRRMSTCTSSSFSSKVTT